MGAYRGSPPATRDVHTQGACAAAAAGQGSMVEKPPLTGAADAAFHLPEATRLLRAALCSREQRTRHIGTWTRTWMPESAARGALMQGADHCL